MKLVPKRFNRKTKKKNKSDASAEKQGLFSLEQRIVFDAAAPAAITEFAESSGSQSGYDAPDTDPVADFVAALNEPDLIEAGNTRNEIIFIDSSVEDALAYVTAMDARAEVILLDPHGDGLLEIADVLATRSQIDALHIITHGSESTLELGNAQLDPHNFTASHEAALSVFANVLSDTANVQFYGSAFGTGEQGDIAAKALSQAIGAEVSTSAQPSASETAPVNDVPAIVADALATPNENAANSIVFIDQDLENLDQLISSIDPGYEVVMIDGTGDGVEQIAFALDERSDLAAIHILSHGEKGRLFLGDAVLDSDSMRGEHADELTLIGQALSEDGDILIYGCDFTGGAEGLEAAILLGGMTRADIAASRDGTGHINRGGDWELEEHFGDVGTNSLAAEDWEGVLAPAAVSAAANEAPVAKDDAFEVMEDHATVFNPLLNDKDVESDVYLTEFTLPGLGELELEVGESGSLEVGSEVLTIELKRTYTNPVVFVFTTSENHDHEQPDIARVTKVTGNSFDLAIVEPNSENPSDKTDGKHGEEIVSYMVLEAGTWTLADGTVVEVGTQKIGTNAKKFTQIEFDHEFKSEPAVLSQVQTNHTGIEYNEARQEKISTTGYSVMNETADYLSHIDFSDTPESIGYLAIETGTGTWNGMGFEAGITDTYLSENLRRLEFTKDLGPDVNFIGQLTSFEGGDNAHLDGRELNGDGIALSIQEDGTKDQELNHTEESASWLALGGSGILTAATGSNFTIAAKDVDFIYTPVDDVNGVSTSFTYKVKDQVGAEDKASVKLHIVPEADTVTDKVTTQEDTSTTFNVFANDNFEGPVKLTEVTGANNGTVSFNSTGDVTYTPNPDFAGTETLTYRVSEDNVGTIETGTISLTVEAVADAPMIGYMFDGDNIVYAEDTAKAFPTSELTVDLEFQRDETTRNVALLSYATPDNHNEMLVWLAPDGVHVHINGDSYLMAFAADTDLHRLSYSYDANAAADGLKIYLDGELQATHTVTSGALSSGGGLAFGQEQDAVLESFERVQAFEGTLYSANIYNGILTDQQIADQSAGNGDTLSIDFSAMNNFEVAGDPAATFAVFKRADVTFPSTLVNYEATLEDNSTIEMDLRASLTDSDGSETLETMISAIPIGVSLSDGAGNSFTSVAGTTWVDVSSWTLEKIKLTPVANSDADIALKITATSKETSNGETASVTSDVTFVIKAVLDAPLIGYAFDGSDIIYSMDSADAFPTDQITIDLVYQRDNSTDSRAVFSYAVPDSNNEVVVWPTEKYVALTINGSRYRITAAADTDVHRFTFTYDATLTKNNLRAFMDGELIATRSVTTGAITSGGALVFGHDQDDVLTNFDAKQSFKGTLYSADIYSSVLTDEQVAENSAGNGDTVSLDFSRLNNFSVGGDTSSTIKTFTRGVVTDPTTIERFGVTLEDNDTIPLDLRSHFSDVDGSEKLEALVSSIPVGATLSDGAGNRFTSTAGNTTADVSSWTLENVILTPVANSDSDITLTITATATESSSGDTASVSSEVTFLIQAVADKPDLTTANETNSPGAVINLSDNLAGVLADTDGSESLSYKISNIPNGSIVRVGDGSGGTVTLVPIAGAVTVTEAQKATLQFLPPSGFMGTLTLDVMAIATESPGNSRAAALSADSDVQQITLTIQNAAPTVATPIADRTDADASVITLDTSSAFDDPDGHTLTYSVTGLPAGLSIDASSGIISGTIDKSASQSGSYTVVVTADDGASGTVSDTFVWTVTNPAPTAVADSYTTSEDTAVTGNVLTNDSDPDADSLKATQTLVAGPANGSVSMASDGTFTYTPNPDFNGTDSFTYQISDGEGGIDEAVATIVVEAVADTPLIGYEFSGSDILYTEDTADAFPTEKITIDLVYQRDNTASNMTLFSYAVPGEDNEILIFQKDSSFDIWVGGTVTRPSFPATTDVQQLTLTFDGAATSNNLNLYADGVLISTHQIAVTSLTAGGSIVFGQEQDGYQSNFESDQEFDGTYFSANIYDGIVPISEIIDGSVGSGDVVSLDFSKVDIATVTGDADAAINTFNRGNVIYPSTIVPLKPTIEDLSSIILDLRTSMQSTNATETLTTVISAIPVGANISDGAGNSFTSVTGTTSVDVSTWTLENIVLKSAANDDSDVTLVVTSTAEEPSNGDTATTESQVTFIIKADADVPTLTTSDETSVRNTTLDLSDNITGSLNDTDGSESLSYTISNILAGSVLTVSDGAGGTTTPTATAGVVTITEAQRATLKYTPPPGLLGTITLYVVATATESASGDQVDDKTADSAREEIVLTITNGLPVVTTPIADQTDVDAADVSLNASTGFSDTDGGTLTFSVTGLPTGLSIDSSTGVISGTIDNSASQAGPYSVVVTAKDNDGGTVTDAFTWTVNNPAPTVTSALADQSGEDAATISLNASTAFTDADADTLTYSATGLPTGLSIDASSGLISGTIDNSASQAGPYSVAVTATDGEGGTVTDEFEWVITNPAPTVTSATNDQTSADDTTVSLNVSAAFTDSDADTLTYSVTGLPAGLSIDAPSGIISGTIDNSASQTGPYTVVVTANDGEGGTVTDTFIWTVTNPGPVALSDRLTTGEDTLGSGDVSVNDSDVDGDDLTWSQLTNPTNGAVSFNANGTFTYTPNANFNGTDSFTYTVRDGEGGADTATVNIAVTPVNDAPVIGVVANQTHSDGQTITPFKVTSSDVDGDTLTYSAVDLPTGLSIDSASGEISGTIDNSASLTSPWAVEVTVSDGDLTDTVAFSWTVTNPAPTAVDDSYTTDEDTAVTGNVLSNDTDSDGDDLATQTTLVTDSVNGSVSLADDGTFTYTPTSNYNGTDTFTYRISDGEGGFAEATVNITINAVNDLPSVVAPIVDQSNEDNQSVSLATSQAFTDLDGDTLTYAATGLPSGLSIGATTGIISGTIDNSASQAGPYSVTVTASDGNGGSIADTFTWEILNPAPVAGNDINATTEDNSVTGNVLSNDRDPDGDALNALTVLVQEPSNGSVSLSASGDYTYTPAPDFNGTDTFVYRVSDGEGGTSTASVEITVTAVNDAPVVSQALEDQTNEDSEVVSVIIADAFDDIEGDTLTYSASGLPAGLTLDAVTGEISGTIDNSASVNAPHTVTILASDGNGGAVSTSFDWNISNPGPNAVNDFVSTTEDVAVSANLLDNDTDPDGDRLRSYARPVALPANGTISIESDGTFTYTPNLDFNGTDQFSYSITDDEGGYSEATVFVTVVASNDAPHLVVEVPDQAYFDADDVALDISTNFDDVDGNTLTYSADTLPPGLALDSTTGIINGILPGDASQASPYTVTITATDPIGLSVSDTFEIEITNRNPVVDTPLENLSAFDEGSVSIDAGSAFSDGDGDTLTFSASGLPGGLSIDPVTGTISGVLDSDASMNGTNSDGRYDITVSVDDGQGGTLSDDFVLQVNNQIPTVDSLIDSQQHGDGETVTLNVANNFTNPDNDPLTYTATGLPKGLSIDPVSGLISGTIDSDASLANGPYQVTVQVDDGQGGVASQTFEWTVTNPSPSVHDEIADQEGYDTEPISLDTSGFFVDPDADALSYSASGLPAGLTFDASTGLITGIIDHSASVDGPYAVTITADDGQGGSVSDTFIWTVINLEPTADNQTIESTEDGTFIGTLTSLVDAPDGDGLSTSLLTEPSNGTVGIRGDGTYTYTPDADFNGTDSFVYQVDDGEGGIATGVITLNIAAVNDAPVTTGTISDIALEDGQEDVSISTAGIFSDIDGDALVYSVANLPEGLTIDPNSGEISGTVDGAASQIGTYQILVTATDGNGGKVTSEFSLTVKNVSPEAVDDTVSVNEDDSIDIDVLSNDLSPDGDALNVVVASASNGVVVVNVDGTLTYAPNADFHGEDTITYKVSDGQGGSSTATVVVNVLPMDDGPVTTGSLPQFNFIDSESGIHIDASVIFSDVDNDALTYSASNLPDGLSIKPQTGFITGGVGSSASATGPYKITVTADDGNGGTISSEFVIAVSNPAPVAVDDTIETSEDSVVSGNVLDNDGDPDGDILVVLTDLVSKPENGIVTLDESGNYTYTPNNNFEGTDTFVYAVTDSDGTTSTANVTVTVSGVNDPPVVTTSLEAQSNNIDDIVSIRVAESFTDIDSSELTFNAIGLPPGLTINSDTGEISGTINSLSSTLAPYIVTITASDGSGGSVTTQFNWLVINRDPTSPDQNIETTEDEPVTGKGLEGATDLDGDTLVVITTPVVLPENGTVLINGSGAFTYTPDPGFYGSDQFTYQVIDNRGGAVDVTVFVSILPENEEPGVVRNHDGSDTWLEQKYDEIASGSDIDQTGELDGNDTGIVGVTVNDIRTLGQGFDVRAAHAVSQVVSEIDLLHEFINSASVEFGNLIGNWDALSVTGFTLQTEVTIVGNFASDQSVGHVLVEGFQFERMLYLQITDALPVTDSLEAPRYNATLADGSALPNWISFSPEGLFLLHHPVGVDQISLKIEINISNEEKIEQYISVDILTAKISLIEKPTEKSQHSQVNETDPSMFAEQAEKEISSLEKDALFKAMFE